MQTNNQLFCEGSETKDRLMDLYDLTLNRALGSTFPSPQQNKYAEKDTTWEMRKESKDLALGATVPF